MKFSKLLLVGVAAIAMASCGKKDAGDAPKSETSQQAAKAGAGSPLDSRFTLKDAEAVDIDAFFALFPEKSRPTYETTSFDKGLGATVVRNLRFADADDGESLTVARAEFFGLDLDAIDRVKNAETADPAAPFETLFQKVRLFDVATDGFAEGDENAKLKIGGVEFDQLAMRQGGTKEGGVGDDGARFFNAVNLAGIYFKDAEFTAEGPKSPSVIMQLPDFRLVGLGGGKLGAIIANDLEYTVSQSDASIEVMRAAMGPQGAMFFDGPLAGFIAPKHQRVQLKGFEWRNLDFAGLLEWGLKDEEPPMTAENLIDLGTMKAVGMDMFVNGKKASTAAEMTMTSGKFTWLAPSNIRMDTKGATYDFTAYLPETEADALGVLKTNGLDKVKADGFAEWIWNSKTGVADLNYAVNMDNVADFSTTFGLSNLKLADLAAARADGETNVVAGHGAFKKFSLKLKDEKALDAIFGLAALQMGGTGEDLRQSAPAMIRLSGAQVAQMNPRISAYINAVADFVAKGGTLEIDAQPAAPVAFTTLQATSMSAPQTLPDVINLEVTHKE